MEVYFFEKENDSLDRTGTGPLHGSIPDVYGGLCRTGLG